jgi:hypothetical protein
LIFSFLENVCDEDWNHLIDEGIFTSNEVRIKKDLLRFNIVGLLLAYNIHHHPDNYDLLQTTVKEQFSEILEILT